MEKHGDGSYDSMPDGTSLAKISQMKDAEEAHAALVKAVPMYQETAHWTPVIVPREHLTVSVVGWLANRGLRRGDRTSRNDYLAPIGRLFLFKDRQIAMEFKLIWG